MNWVYWKLNIEIEVSVKKIKNKQYALQLIFVVTMYQVTAGAYRMRKQGILY